MDAASPPPAPSEPPAPAWGHSDVTIPSSGSVVRVYHNTPLDLDLLPPPAEPPNADVDHTHHQEQQQGEEEYEHPVLVFIHGGGHTGVSWTLPCLELAKLCQVSSSSSSSSSSAHTTTHPPTLLALDLPFHGQTHVCPDDGDMSMKRLVREVLACLTVCLAGGGRRRRRRSLTLIGHSVGGACVIRLAHEPALATLGTVKGVCVVDMVEGAALANLSHMHARLQDVPQRFPSVDAAIEWSLGVGAVHRNEESALLSVPAQLKAVGEEGGYEWITDLRTTEPFWVEWFTGLSEAFLSIRAPKLLVLANYSLLESDRAICAAQMQGSFQMEFMAGGGHALHEDFPLHFARTLFRFLHRNRILPPLDASAAALLLGGRGGGGGGGVGDRSPSSYHSHSSRSRSSSPSSTSSSSSSSSLHYHPAAAAASHAHHPRSGSMSSTSSSVSSSSNQGGGHTRKDSV